jgi:hypothetical protein
MNKMVKYQKPAEGVLKTDASWGNSLVYHVRCDCGDEYCSHEVEIEADKMHIQVHTHLIVHTRWSGKSRWKQIWQILTKGYAEMQSTIVMKEQTALNYAETIKVAIIQSKKL